MRKFKSFADCIGYCESLFYLANIDFTYTTLQNVLFLYVTYYEDTGNVALDDTGLRAYIETCK